MALMGGYIEVDGVPVRCEDTLEWGKWMHDNDRTVRKTKVGDILISTIFLGLDHSYDPDLRLLYETMCFDSPSGRAIYGLQERYSTRKQAEKGHERIRKYIASLRS